MPRVPILEAPSVQSRPVATPDAKLDTRDGTEAIAEGAGQLAEGTEHLDRAIQKAKQRAIEVITDDGATALQHFTNGRLQGTTSEPGAVGGQGEPGFLSTRGMTAAAASKDTLDSITKKRKEISTSLTDPEARKLFEKKTNHIFEGAFATIEHHVAGERAQAEQATLKARAESGLQTIANSFADPLTVETETKAVETSIRRLQLSPEDGDAKVAEFKTESTKVRLNQYLASKDWEGAQSLFAQTRDQLGGQAATFQKHIDAVKVDSQAETVAREAVGRALQPDGRIDSTAALEQVEKVAGKDTPLLDEARHRVQQRVMQADNAWEKQTKEISSTAFSQYNARGWPGIDAQVRQDLNERNPPLYNRLKDDWERRWKEHKGNKADARRAQLELNRIALNDYQALPVEERATANLDDFAQNYPGLDEVGRSALGPAQRRASDTVQKGEAQPESEFLKEATAAAQNVVRGKEPLATYKAEATLAFEDFREKHKRQPTRDEADKLIANLVLKVKKPGLLWDSEEFSFQAAARARKEGAAQPEPSAKPAADEKIELVGPGGKRGFAPSKGLEEWLAKHPNWKRR